MIWQFRRLLRIIRTSVIRTPGRAAIWTIKRVAILAGLAILALWVFHFYAVGDFSTAVRMTAADMRVIARCPEKARTVWTFIGRDADENTIIEGAAVLSGSDVADLMCEGS